MMPSELDQPGDPFRDDPSSELVEPFDAYSSSSAFDAEAQPFDGSVSPVGDRFDPYAASSPDPYAASSSDPYAGSSSDPYAGSSSDPYAGSSSDPYAASSPGPHVGAPSYLDSAQPSTIRVSVAVVEPLPAARDRLTGSSRSS